MSHRQDIQPSANIMFVDWLCLSLSLICRSSPCHPKSDKWEIYNLKRVFQEILRPKMKILSLFTDFPNSYSVIFSKNIYGFGMTWGWDDTPLIIMDMGRLWCISSPLKTAIACEATLRLSLMISLSFSLLHTHLFQHVVTALCTQTTHVQGFCNV